MHSQAAGEDGHSIIFCGEPTNGEFATSTLGVIFKWSSRAFRACSGEQASRACSQAPRTRRATRFKPEQPMRNRSGKSTACALFAVIARVLSKRVHQRFPHATKR
ncbi:hypothetical protein [Polaromonas sp. YR568]|uniref:hypothetical protein n=1 Tax=Polaromonas sp. YR568 TaxID=1855301 RepID=UPI00398BD65E